MQTAQDTRPQYWLTLDMARSRGIDLPRALVDGIVTRAEYAEALVRCRTCADPRACRDWLAGSAEVPQGCRNGPLFDELRLL